LRRDGTQPGDRRRTALVPCDATERISDPIPTPEALAKF
jgi:hypothetical protein